MNIVVLNVVEISDGVVWGASQSWDSEDWLWLQSEAGPYIK